MREVVEGLQTHAVMMECWLALGCWAGGPGLCLCVLSPLQVGQGWSQSTSLQPSGCPVHWGMCCPQRGPYPGFLGAEQATPAMDTSGPGQQWYWAH